MPPEDTKIVSVVIPFYDRPEMLRQALCSVRDQDFTESMETIVVIDGSQEDLRSIRSEFPGVIFVYQENAGPGAARNRGIEEASGEFIAFLDADDHWHPAKLTVQIDSMRGARSDWSQHSYTVVSPELVVLRHVDTSRYVGNVLLDTLLSFRVQTSAVMVTRECLRDPSLRFGKDRVGEDGHFYFRMAAKYRLTAISDELGYFTWHGANAGGRPDLQLWSRARMWEQNRAEMGALLPMSARFAYEWCALAVRVFGYPSETPPRNASRVAAKIAYAPGYLLFQLLAKRLGH